MHTRLDCLLTNQVDIYQASLEVIGGVFFFSILRVQSRLIFFIGDHLR